jgi:hypothetical protein
MIRNGTRPFLLGMLFLAVACQDKFDLSSEPKDPAPSVADVGDVRAEPALVKTPEVVPAPAPVPEEPEEPAEEPLRWVKVTQDKVYLRKAPSGKAKFVGLARPLSAVPVYEEKKGDGCTGKWLRVGPHSFPGYVCSTQTAKSSAPAPELPGDPVSDKGDPTKRNGLTYAIVIKDAFLFDTPNGKELATARPKESYVTVREEKVIGKDTWVRVDGGWLPKTVLRAAQAKGISALRGEILPEGASLPFVFVVAKEAKLFANPGDTTGEVGTVKRFDRFPVQEVVEREGQKPGEMVRWARVEGGWLEGKKLDWITQQPRPEHVGPDQKWIFADLEQQSLTAYEGDKPVFVTLFSSGKAPNLTVTGTYTIHRVYRTHTMENAPGGDLSSYYYVADIPFTMFFHKTFALHGAFWHDNFGFTRSHGCVNMTPADAKWIYEWMSPQLPLGWWGMALDEEEAKEAGWTTVVTKWGDKIVRDEDVMNPNAAKVVEEMRKLREKQANGEAVDALEADSGDSIVPGDATKPGAPTKPGEAPKIPEPAKPEEKKATEATTPSETTKAEDKKPSAAPSAPKESKPSKAAPSSAPVGG